VLQQLLLVRVIHAGYGEVNMRSIASGAGLVLVCVLSCASLAAQTGRVREPFSADVTETTDVMKVAPERAASYLDQRGTVIADSLGRLRFDLVSLDAAAGAERGRISRIVDPVVGWIYRLREKQKVAVRRPLRRTPHGGDAQTPNLAPSMQGTPDQEIEDLGWRTIEGEECHGQRQTEFQGAGANRSILYTLETWRSDRIKFELLWIYRDETGVTLTRSLHALTVGEEPPAALFTVPPGYEIVDASSRVGGEMD
jgi:hypothetical protein